MPTFVHQVQLELTFSPERYAVSNNEWHFVAFSFDSFSKRGIVVLDDHVEKFAAPGAAIFDAAFDQHKVLVGGNRGSIQLDIENSIEYSIEFSIEFCSTYCGHQGGFGS